MRFNAKRTRSKYKSSGTYLRAVFNNNKGKISKNIADVWIKLGIAKRDNLSDIEFSQITDEEVMEARKDSKLVYKRFKGLVEERMKYKNPKTRTNPNDPDSARPYTMEEAIIVESRSKDLNRTWTTGDVYSRNFHSKILQSLDVKEQFYKNEGIYKVDYSKYKFEGYYNYDGSERAVYSYGNSYFLEAKSPSKGSGATITYMTAKDFDEYERTGKIVLEKYRKSSI